jgi:hypothetical protein
MASSTKYPDPYITIFSAPKAFTNSHVAVIQCNAMRSWLHLGKEVTAAVIGEEAGMAEAVAEVNADVTRDIDLHQFTDVARNSAGTPLVSSIFALARQASPSPVMAYVNADILLLPDFVQAVRCVAEQSRKFLIIGQRWDLDLPSLFDFSTGWDQRLVEEVKIHARLHAPAGSDFFVFPRELFTEMPDFAIGRAGWDNWMIYEARQQGWLVVDGTPAMMVIHQDHDYSHLPGGKPHYELPESQQNQTLAGGSANLYMVLDSTCELRDGRLQTPRANLLRILRWAEVSLTPKDGKRKGLSWIMARQFRRLRRRVTRSV